MSDGGWVMVLRVLMYMYETVQEEHLLIKREFEEQSSNINEITINNNNKKDSSSNIRLPAIAKASLTKKLTHV